MSEVKDGQIKGEDGREMSTTRDIEKSRERNGEVVREGDIC